MIKKHHQFLFFIIILLIAAFLRFYNLNWDQGNYFHPDERNISGSVSQIKFFDQLNPNFFAYGGFSIYLYRSLGEITAFISDDKSWVSDWGNINLIGRFISAFISIFSLIPLFFLAKAVFNQRVAWLSIIFYTFAVSSVQSAHFATTESLLVFWGLTLALVSESLATKASFKKYLLCGILLGFASAIKTTALSFIIFPLSAFAYLIFSQKIKFKNILNQAASFCFLILTALLIFTIFSPFSFLSWDKFLESMNYESGVVTGKLLVCYVYQFINTPSFLFQFNNLFWQMGLINLLWVPGIILMIYQLIKKPLCRKYLIILSFPIIYFAYMGWQHTKFIRYMLPLIPFLIIFSSVFLDFLITRFKKWGYLVTYFLIITSIIWAAAFFSIYTKDQTRIAASVWIYQNIPPGAKIYTEHWDDGLPLSLDGNHPSKYQIEQLTIYETDSAEKARYLADKLSRGDYLILSSRRLWGTLIHLTDMYPITSTYYKLLFEGKLGYEKVAEFTSYPSISRFTINDDSSEESFQVYDHPQVIIFRNTKHLDFNQYLNIFKVKI